MIILLQADGVRGNLRSAEKAGAEAEAEVHQDESEGHREGKR